MVEFENPKVDTIANKWFCVSTKTDVNDGDYFYLVSEHLFKGKCPLFVTKLANGFPMYFDSEIDAYKKLIEYYSYHKKTFTLPQRILNVGEFKGSRELEL